MIIKTDYAQHFPKDDRRRMMILRHQCREMLSDLCFLGVVLWSLSAQCNQGAGLEAEATETRGLAFVGTEEKTTEQRSKEETKDGTKKEPIPDFSEIIFDGYTDVILSGTVKLATDYTQGLISSASPERQALVSVVYDYKRLYEWQAARTIAQVNEKFRLAFEGMMDGSAREWNLAGNDESGRFHEMTGLTLKHFHLVVEVTGCEPKIVEFDRTGIFRREKPLKMDVGDIVVCP